MVSINSGFERFIKVVCRQLPFKCDKTGVLCDLCLTDTYGNINNVMGFNMSPTVTAILKDITSIRSQHKTKTKKINNIHCDVECHSC